MRLDKRSEFSKKFRRMFRVLIRLVIVLIVLSLIVWFLIHKGYLHLTITDGMEHGAFGWFFRIAAAQGWRSAIFGTVFILVAIFGYFFASERRRKLDDFYKDLEKRNRL